MKANFETTLASALVSIRKFVDLTPEVAIVTGTGLGGIVSDIQDSVIIPYEDIDGFPTSTVEGHAGALHMGYLNGQCVFVMNGRFHLYEGYSPDDIVLPIYVMAAMGVHTLILTNAVGALNPAYRPGDIGLIADHINFTGTHVLSGPNLDAYGPRFPDLSAAYDKPLRACAAQHAKTLGLNCHEGVYAAVHGPELETNAERKFLHMIGADFVGMSTVHEVIAANHASLRTLVISAITNAATGGPEQDADTLENIITASANIAPNIQALIKRLIPLETPT